MERIVENPFHSRIFRIYLLYLQKNLGWDDERISTFIKRLDIDRARLEDDSSWFSAEFADHFYEELLKETGDDRLAYHAGLCIQEISVGPLVHRLIRGALDVSFVYRLLTRYSSHFSKVAAFRVIRVESSEAQIESQPLLNFKERPYMCENRRGMLEGIPKLFGLPAAKIHERECLHRGGGKCTYDVKWEALPERTGWLRGLLWSVGGLLLGALIDARTSFFSGLMGLILFLFFSFKKQLLSQRLELLRQNEALDQSIKMIESRNQQLQLIGKVAQMTHSLTSPDILAKSVVRQVCDSLGFDRCILLITDFERQVLKVVAFHGFDSKLEALLSQTEFNLNADNAAGFFVKVVNTKEPVLITDVDASLHQLSARSQKFAKTLATKSFVAVPLIDDSQEVVGVLSVDNISQSRNITISDQDLLMTLAQHLGIAVHNAKLVRKLEENLQISNKLSFDEKNLREVFQKFVPRDLALDLVSSVKMNDQVSRLNQVRKRSAAILFLDIFNFSSTTDGMEPENIVDLLNTAFSIFEPLVSSNGGFVDKFMGDGLVAIFEGTLGCRKASKAGLELIRSIEDINLRLQKKDYPSINIGIGINVGPVILGNTGSDHRLNFTAIGDSVNLAARLESHTRKLGPNSICISSQVFDQLQDFSTKVIDLGKIDFKGFNEPVHAYRLEDFSSAEGTKRVS